MEQRIKRVVFDRKLIELILSQAKEITFRTHALLGRYVVASSRFQRDLTGAPILDFFRVDQVPLEDLTDDDAKATGLTDLESLKDYLTRKYGGLPQRLYRCHFRLNGTWAGASTPSAGRRQLSS